MYECVSVFSLLLYGKCYSYVHSCPCIAVYIFPFYVWWEWEVLWLPL